MNGGKASGAFYLYFCFWRGRAKDPSRVVDGADGPDILDIETDLGSYERWPPGAGHVPRSSW